MLIVFVIRLLKERVLAQRSTLVITEVRKQFILISEERLFSGRNTPPVTGSRDCLCLNLISQFSDALRPQLAGGEKDENTDTSMSVQ